MVLSLAQAQKGESGGRVSSKTIQTMNRPRKNCSQIPKPLGKRRDYFKTVVGDPLPKKGTSPPVDAGMNSTGENECLPEEPDSENKNSQEGRSTPGSKAKEHKSAGSPDSKTLKRKNDRCTLNR